MYRYLVQSRFSSPHYTQPDWLTVSQHRTRAGAETSLGWFEENHGNPFTEYRLLDSQTKE